MIIGKPLTIGGGFNSVIEAITSAGEGTTIDILQNGVILKTYTLTGAETSHQFIVDRGTYTVRATKGVKTLSRTVLVDATMLYKTDVSFDLYVYDNGDECTDVSGGWRVVAMGTHSWIAGGGTATKYSRTNYVEIKVTAAQSVASGGALYCATPIDMTYHNQLSVKCRSITYSGGHDISSYVDVTPTITANYVPVKTATILTSVIDQTSDSGIVTRTLDISDLTGSYYISLSTAKAGWGTTFYGRNLLYEAVLTA